MAASGSKAADHPKSSPGTALPPVISGITINTWDIQGLPGRALKLLADGTQILTEHVNGPDMELSAGEGSWSDNSSEEDTTRMYFPSTAVKIRNGLS
jgi:hypothetical protein